ncbi:MAG: ABC transporter substrate-binding protein [Dehalococcoidia bacterium]|nr:ABC transporter substrate-binding protein [Dehalococcoidia bacterium]
MDDLPKVNELFRLTVSDVVSPSYFVAIAAVALGSFSSEGLDVELVPAPPDGSQALRDGEVDFIGGSPYIALGAFPGWRDGKVLCALAHHTYWFLALRSDIPARRGDVSVLKGLRISAATGPGMALKHLLTQAGLDLERDNIRIVPTPHHESGNWAWDGVRAIQEDLADAYWGNGMRAALGVRHGVARILLDVRRGDGPAAARGYTFPALVTTSRFLSEHADAAAGAVRAIVKTQKMLRANPDLAAEVGRSLFPEEEARLISNQVAHDSRYYKPQITRGMMRCATLFARELGLLSGDVSYEEIVALQFSHLWR